MKYLLTFKPLKNFFFGSNQTFSEDYLAISEYFPQYTQLLGAIRLYIAEQNKLIKVYKNGKYCKEPQRLQALTGTAKSIDFAVNSDLGCIHNLSQLFIVNKALDDAYFPTPFDIEVLNEKIKYYTLASIDDNYFLKDYDVKNHSEQSLGSSNFWKSYLNGLTLYCQDVKSFDEIFIHRTQTGIELKDKQTIDGQFYSKIDYTLDNNYLFAALLDFDKELEDGIIEIGAESSLFELKVKKLEMTTLKDHPIVSRLFTKAQTGDKVVCISDTIMESSKGFHSYFTIIPYAKSFRTLDKKRSQFKGKSKEKFILPAGTVSYIKDQIMPHSNMGAYAKMGFNQIITVKGN